MVRAQRRTPLVQVELADREENTRLICWVPWQRDLKRGVEITLQEIPGKRWRVWEVYEELPLQEQPNRGWTVGGLS